MEWLDHSMVKCSCNGRFHCPFSVPSATTYYNAIIILQFVYGFICKFQFLGVFRLPFLLSFQWCTCFFTVFAISFYIIFLNGPSFRILCNLAPRFCRCPMHTVPLYGSFFTTSKYDLVSPSPRYWVYLDLDLSMDRSKQQQLLQVPVKQQNLHDSLNKGGLGFSMSDVHIFDY